MSFRLPCPACQAPQAVSDTYLGRLVRCQRCGHAFRVERPGTDVPTATDPDNWSEDDRETRPSRPAVGAGTWVILAGAAGVLGLMVVVGAYLFLSGRPADARFAPPAVAKTPVPDDRATVNVPFRMAPRPMQPDLGPMVVPVVPPINAPNPNPVAAFGLPADAGRILVVGFAADGVTVVAGTDADVAVWVTLTGRIVARSPGRAGADRLVSAAVSPDGQRVAFARNGGPLVYVDRLNPDVPVEIRSDDWGEPGQEKVAFSPDGRRLVTGHADGWVRVSETKGDGKPVREWQRSNNPVCAVAWAPDRTTIVSADTTLKLYDAEKLDFLFEVPRSRERAYSALAFSSNGRRLAAAKENAVLLWDIYAGRPHPLGLRTIAVADRVVALALSSDGGLVAGVDHAGNVVVWETDSLQPRMALPSTARGVRPDVCLAFSPDGRRLAVGQGAAVQVYDTKAGGGVSAPVKRSLRPGPSGAGAVPAQRAAGRSVGTCP
jgi:predicted Zn finger-like uncharacterized protein